MAARCVDGSEQPHSCRAAGMPSLAEKLLRLASFLLLRVALQLFLQLLVLYHLIGALPDLFISDFGWTSGAARMTTLGRRAAWLVFANRKKHLETGLRGWGGETRTQESVRERCV